MLEVRFSKAKISLLPVSDNDGLQLGDSLCNCGHLFKFSLGKSGKVEMTGKSKKLSSDLSKGIIGLHTAGMSPGDNYKLIQGNGRLS